MQLAVLEGLSEVKKPVFNTDWNTGPAKSAANSNLRPKEIPHFSKLFDLNYAASCLKDGKPHVFTDKMNNIIFLGYRSYDKTKGNMPNAFTLLYDSGSLYNGYSKDYVEKQRTEMRLDQKGWRFNYWEKSIDTDRNSQPLKHYYNEREKGEGWEINTAGRLVVGIPQRYNLFLMQNLSKDEMRLIKPGSPLQSAQIFYDVFWKVSTATRAKLALAIYNDWMAEITRERANRALASDLPSYCLRMIYTEWLNYEKMKQANAYPYIYIVYDWDETLAWKDAIKTVASIVSVIVNVYTGGATTALTVALRNVLNTLIDTGSLNLAQSYELIKQVAPYIINTTSLNSTVDSVVRWKNETIQNLAEYGTKIWDEAVKATKGSVEDLAKNLGINELGRSAEDIYTHIAEAIDNNDIVRLYKSINPAKTLQEFEKSALAIELNQMIESFSSNDEIEKIKSMAKGVFEIPYYQTFLNYCVSSAENAGNLPVALQAVTKFMAYNDKKLTNKEIYSLINIAVGEGDKNDSKSLKYLALKANKERAKALSGRKTAYVLPSNIPIEWQQEFKREIEKEINIKVIIPGTQGKFGREFI